MRREADRKEADVVAAARPREVPTFVGYAEDVIERRFSAVLSDGAMGVQHAALRAWKGFFGARDGRRPRGSTAARGSRRTR